MIALAIFAVFMVVFATSNSYNLLDSTNMKEEILLRQLAETTINDIILNPPKNLDKSITLGPGDIKTIEGYEDYESKVVYKEFTVPDMTKLKKAKGEDGDTPKNPMEDKVYEIIKENMEKLIWQVEVTIKNKKTNFTTTLSTWILNDKVEVNVKGF